MIDSRFREWVGTATVAAVLGVGQETVRKWCRSGRLRSATKVHALRRWRVSRSEVELLLNLDVPTQIAEPRVIPLSSIQQALNPQTEGKP